MNNNQKIYNLFAYKTKNTQNVESTAKISGGSKIGSGIYSFDEWLQMSDNPRVPGAKDAVDCDSKIAINRNNLTQKILDSIDSWSRKKGSKLEVATICGKHGTGRSWLVYSMLHELRNMNCKIPIYVVDDIYRFHNTDLTSELKGLCPLILVIDDADMHAALDPLVDARDLEMFVVCTGAAKAQTKAIASIPISVDAVEIDIPSAPTADELIRMQEVFQNPTLSAEHRKVLRRGPIRSSARVLGSGEDPKEVATRMIDIFFNNDNQLNRKVLRYVVDATANDLLIPESLLYQILEIEEIPDSCKPWIHYRQFHESDNITSSLLWVEDAEVARFAIGYERSRREVSEATAALQDADYLKKLLEHGSKVDNPSYADFVRRRLQKEKAEAIESIISDKQSDVAKIIAHESRIESLISWMSILKSVQISEQIIRIMSQRKSKIVKQNPLKTILPILTSEYPHRQELISKFTPVWSVEQWADLMSLFKYLPDKMKSRFIDLYGKCMREQLSDNPALHKASLLEDIVIAMEPFGKPGDRDWILRASYSHKPNPQLLRYVFALTERCIMQRRSNFALGLFQPDQLDLKSSDLLLKYEQLRNDERLASWALNTFNWSSELLYGNRWSHRAQAASQIINFSNVWVPDKYSEIMNSSIHMLNEFDSIPLDNNTKKFLWQLSHEFSKGYLLDIHESIPPLLSGLDKRNMSDQDAQRFIKIMAGFARQDNALGDSARSSLSAVFLVKGGQLAEALTAYRNMLFEQTGIPLTHPSSLFSLDSWKHGRRGSINEGLLFSVIDSHRVFDNEMQKELLLKSIFRWGNIPRIRARLIFWAIRLNALDDCPIYWVKKCSDLMEVVSIAISAVRGNPASARNRLQIFSENHIITGQGAHPNEIHFLLGILADRSEGADKFRYSVIKKLSTRYPLEEINSIDCE